MRKYQYVIVVCVRTSTHTRYVHTLHGLCPTDRSMPMTMHYIIKATVVADALFKVVNKKRTSRMAAMNGKNKFLLGLLYPYPSH
jgi:hypothetical protein